MKLNLLNVSAATLRKALALIEARDAKDAEITALLTGQSVGRKTCKTVRKCGKRSFTPEQKAAISAGLKAKWAARKAAAAAAPVPVTSA